MKPSYNPTTSLLGTYSEQIKTEYQKIPATSMFIVTSFMIAKIGKQSEYPSADERIM